jgi:protein-serine/threonine kinase
MDQGMGHPSTQRVQSIQLEPSGGHAKGGHKRSNTVTETFGRMTSMFSGRQPSYSQDPKGSMTSQSSYANYPEEKKQKSYPPTSMAGPISNDNIAGGSRPSMDSSRRTSFGFTRRNTNTSSGEAGKSSRRFSLLPSTLSKTFGSQRDSLPAKASYSERRDSSARPRASSKPAFGRGESRSPSQSTQGSNMPGFYDGAHDSSSRIRATHAAGPSSAPPNQTQFASGHNNPAYPIADEKFPDPRDQHPSGRPHRQPTEDSEEMNPYPQGMGGNNAEEAQQRKGVLQKSRKFHDAYDGEGGNKGSSGSSKRVMDFFRRMGKQRNGGGR